MTTERNPHCAEQWPHNMGFDHRAAKLADATYGARVIARLLDADHQLALDLADADDPSGLPLPFTANTACGLRAALRVCLEEITCISEALEDCTIIRNEVRA